MRKTYKHYPVLTTDRLRTIRDSIEKEHTHPHEYVSRAWLIESLSQCVCYLEGIGCLESVPKMLAPTKKGLDYKMISANVINASLLIPFKFEDADDDWDEVTEQLQAIEWGEGIGA